MLLPIGCRLSSPTALAGISERLQHLDLERFVVDDMLDQGVGLAAAVLPGDNDVAELIEQRRAVWGGVPVDLGEPQRLELVALGLVDYLSVHVVYLVAADIVCGGVDLVEVEVLPARIQVLVEEVHGADDVVGPLVDRITFVSDSKYGHGGLLSLGFPNGKPHSASIWDDRSGGQRGLSSA